MGLSGACGAHEKAQSMKAPLFLSLAQVAELHRLSLELHGGQEGLRDPAAIDVARQCGDGRALSARPRRGDCSRVP